MTAEFPQHDTSLPTAAVEPIPAVEAAEYEDPRLRTLEETGMANAYTIDLMRDAQTYDTANVQPAPSEIPEAAFVVPRRVSRRGGRSYPEMSGRDRGRQIDEEMRQAEKDRPVAGEDSIPKALTFQILAAVRNRDREQHVLLLKKLDAFERGEVVTLSEPDTDEVA